MVSANVHQLQPETAVADTSCTMPDLGNGIVYYLVFLFSATAHEAAHAWAAKLGGDLTAYHGGQVSLDPRPHIRREPFGMVILPVLSTLVSGWPFGFASAPYDPHWALRYPRRAGWMAVAGPAANVAIVLLCVIAIRVGALVGVFYPPDSVGFESVVASQSAGVWPGVAFLVSVCFSLNLMLACLNMLPLPPLDGSAAILLVLGEETSARYQQFLMSSPAFGMVGMIAAWQLFDVVFDPIFLVTINLIYPGVSYG
jgi:Zn-dependent protease